MKEFQNVARVGVTLAMIIALSGAGIASADSRDSHESEHGGYGGEHNKVELCHSGKTLEVAQSAVAAHLAHGDKLGECKKEKKDDKGGKGDDKGGKGDDKSKLSNLLTQLLNLIKKLS